MTARRTNQLSLLLLLLGFGSALIIWFVAPPDSDDGLLSDPLANKKYRHEMEVYGGKANVLSAEFREWFANLWYGENLAYTVAVLTVGVTWSFRFVANHPSNQTGENTKDRSA